MMNDSTLERPVHPPLTLPLESWCFARKSMAEPVACGKDCAGFHPSFGHGDGVYRATVAVPADGAVVLNLVCPRPIRLYANAVLVFDQPLSWHSFQRQVTGLAVFPAKRGEMELLVEVGPRPKHPEHIDRDCPSRNREALMRQLEIRYPDQFELRIQLHEGHATPSVSMRFEPTQFREEGVVYQHVILQDLQDRFSPPSPNLAHPGEKAPSVVVLRTSVLPSTAVEISAEKDQMAGLRRFAVPVAEPQDVPPPLRGQGVDDRLEPSVEVARWLNLHIESAAGRISVRMPGYESLGRHAPRQQYHELAWPKLEDLLSGVPQPVLPPALSHYDKLYRAAWAMFLQLVRVPKKETGAINSYISTGSIFGLHQFVWDSSFTSMAASYAWRVLPAYAQLDNLYSRQFDGGYIHRDHNWVTGVLEIYEPDFSPNPPIMSIAEWQIAKLTGNLKRLRDVYPLLKANHQWIWNNRRLPDGTFWTTGLANGLDNSPSMGDGYPDLSAQMAHEAEILKAIARRLGLDQDAREFQQQYEETCAAINDALWDETQQIYSSSLPGGGHNPNKVVTAFWPLWAGIVEPVRVEALARHLLDPKSFWRHHPIPSLAADSPRFSPDGDYWLGSTWAPTNYAAIKGFDRCGRHDLAVKTTLRHLDGMSEVFEATGQIWENYCSERSEQGNASGSPYCWSALGPISLLLEVVIGLEPDALENSMTWTLPDIDNLGIRNYSLGANTLSLVQRLTAGRRQLQIRAQLPFTLHVIIGNHRQTFQCGAGDTTLRL